MGRRPKLTGMHPDLQQSGIDVDKSRPPEPPDHLGPGSVAQVEKQIGLGGRVQVEGAVEPPHEGERVGKPKAAEAGRQSLGVDG